MARLRVAVGGVMATVGQWSNTFEFLLDSAITSQTILQTITTAIRANLVASTAFKAGYCSDTTLVTVKCLHYATNTGTANLVAEAGGTPQAGTPASAAPPQVCVVASLRTGLAGRSQRGRIYVPYRAGTIANTGVVSSTGQGVVAAYVNAVVTAVAAAAASSSHTLSWIVWSPKLGAAYAITNVLVGSQCDTMRHRNMNRDETYTAYAIPSLVMDAPDELTLEELQALANRAIEGLQGPVGLETTLGVLAGAALVGFDAEGNRIEPGNEDDPGETPPSTTSEKSPKSK